jgi:ElaB/YqjD/DUF883 family membrane-anchored ribosome-binding protein
MSDDKPSLWDEIKRVSDELELKVHLGTMEAKERWAQLKPRVKALQDKADAKATHAGERVVEEMHNVGKLLKELRDDVVARAH